MSPVAILGNDLKKWGASVIKPVYALYAINRKIQRLIFTKKVFPSNITLSD